MMATFGAISPSGSSRSMPDFAAIDPAASSGLASLAADAAARVPSGVSLYVHVPFCRSKCAYCDFLSVPAGGPEDPGRGFAGCVLRDLRAAEKILTDVPTLYVGGGTPTILGERLAELVRTIREHAGLRRSAEVTVEANPDSTTLGLLEALSEAGVTRVSVGAQSFDDEILRTLGRCHDAGNAAEAARDVLAAGMRLSVDLMCGIPGQSMRAWRETLERAVATGAGHASVYALSVEEGTPMAAAVMAGTLPEPDPDLAAEMMLAAEEHLSAAGLARYEVANHARPGEESRHNMRYWTGGEYIGIGPGAASMLTARRFAGLKEIGKLGLEGRDLAAASRVRFTANSSIEDFFQEGFDGMPDELELLLPEEAAREDVMLGLRLTAGVPAEQAAEADLASTLEGLRAGGLVELREERWRTTRRGWLLGNEVFGAVWAGEGTGKAPASR